MNAPKPKLDIDTTRERLAALGCSHAAEHLDQVLSDAVRHFGCASLLLEGVQSPSVILSLRRISQTGWSAGEILRKLRMTIEPCRLSASAWNGLFWGTFGSIRRTECTWRA